MNPALTVDFSRPITLDSELEQVRLKSLHALDLMDTRSEERFDRITRLASNFFEVPISYVALIDSERQWFKSRQGLCLPSTSRQDSLCQYTIEYNAPFILTDTLEHETARLHPLVAGDPFLRFYAGIPLQGSEHGKIGTFCLADIKPRHFSSEDIHHFRSFAELVQRELNVSHVMRAQQELIVTRERLANELAEASKYIRSMIAPPLSDPVSIQWHFEPSTLLGGDGLGYRWINPDQVAIYVIDVTGHGVGAALVAVSILEFMRSHDGRDLDFSRPAEILQHLNHIFRMDNHNGKFLCAWYGVYSLSRKTLTYANAGNPPALFIRPRSGHSRQIELSENGDFVLGVLPEIKPREITCELPPGSDLLVFTDGIYELQYADGQRGDLKDFIGFVEEKTVSGLSAHLALREWTNTARQQKAINDDVSFIHLSV